MDIIPSKITVSQEDVGKGATFFFDLAIIMPLKKATLRLYAEDECRILVGDEYIFSENGKRSYDITGLCEENDYFALSFEAAPDGFCAEILLEFAGGIEQKVVSGGEWTYGDFYLTDDMLCDRAKYILETTSQMNKPVRVIAD